MSFQHPLLLLLLAIPVLWGVWSWSRRGLPLVLPFDHKIRREGRRLRTLTSVAGLLPAALLAVGVLLLAGPRRPAPPQDQRVMANILFCLDVSGSMSTPAGGFMMRGGPSRYEAAMEAINEFCDYRKGDAFGLTIFGSEYLHWLPPTKELSAIKFVMPFANPGRLPPWFGGTMIAQALWGCRDQLIKTPEGDRLIILVTDGQSSDFGGGRDRQVAEDLKNAAIRVFAVVIGVEPSAGVPTSCSTTGGKAFRAGDPAAMDAIFHEIDRMQKAHFQTVAPDWVDCFRPIALAGLALAGLFGLAQLGLRYTPW